MHCYGKSSLCWYRIVYFFLFFICSILFVFMSGCTDSESVDSAVEEKQSLRNATPVVLVPEVSKAVSYESMDVILDASNTSQGYVMMKYTGDNEKVRFQIKMPDDTEYTYSVVNTGEYNVYPLSGGSGTYQMKLFEAVLADSNQYAMVFTQEIKVDISDEFAPFLYPNYYVDFSADSQAVAKGQELAEMCTDDLQVVANIYEYVMKNISYDTEKAKNVEYGYRSDIDDVLKSRKGICFDYAALMTAMLRSQQIPTKLEVGYVGEIYHAWISCYVAKKGWVDNIIEFDGRNWTLMDPTLAANNDRESVKEYIGDGSNYVEKYCY